ncbi:MliC family protein [Pseudomonas mangiferae]|uniref:Lysozyme inhibitor n=1 Tax=Pseudomonas mangiferae TaxID=2593654 RepID=A0A553GTW5_9PSED|nr:MliC family protein [Pseudomonas mangiferae]TRX72964.1 lysozyme inhibitor [Pseudomonas mangiferae]
MNKVIPLSLLALLAGCAGQREGDSDHWTRWVCDSQAEVLWRYVDAGQSIVDLRLGEKDVVHHLEKEPATSGAFYTDGRLAFDLRDDQGLVYWVATDDLVGRGCKAP